MAITQALCNSFKTEIIQGIHLASNDYYIALYTSTASLDKTTTTYTGVLNEVANGNGYLTTGKILTGYSVTLDGDTAILDFSPVTWSASSITARGALIYNHSLAGKNAVCVLSFGSDYSSTNGDFTVTFPVSGAATSLIRIV